MMMVENIARAMYEAQPDQWTYGAPKWDSEYPDTRDSLRAHARAALTALLEPSEGMTVAAREVACDGDVVGGVIYNTANEARGTFRAMVQAALDEKDV